MFRHQIDETDGNVPFVDVHDGTLDRGTKDVVGYKLTHVDSARTALAVPSGLRVSESPRIIEGTHFFFDDISDLTHGAFKQFGTDN